MLAGKEPFLKKLMSWRKKTAQDSRRFGQYDILRILHDGEKAALYEARLPTATATVAIKSYKFEYNRTARRMRKRYGLRTEGEIGLRITPPDLKQDVPVLRTLGQGWEFGDPSKCYYVVLEYIDGVNLKHMIGCGDPQLKGRRRAILSTVAQGLAIIHERGLVHRDICTDNVMVRKDGAPKLIDLGFAVPTGISFEERSGTPSYMAPEQFEKKPITAAADIYSFGVVMYELFTCKLPFVTRYDAHNPNVAARRTSELRQMHLRDKPKPPSAHAPWLPKEVDGLVLSCMEKSPERRPHDIKQVALAISKLPDSAEGTG